MTDFWHYPRTICTRVVDGDTLDLIVDLGLGVTRKIRCRLRGVDTPEIYGRATKAEKQHGREAAEFVEELILFDGAAPMLMATTHKDRAGKYGRYLVDITLRETGEDLATLIKAAGLEKRSDYDDTDTDAG